MRWENLSDEQKAMNIIGNIDGLTEEDVTEVFEEWRKGHYDDTPRGRNSAFAELQDLAIRRVLKRQGRLEAVDEAWYGN